MITAVVLAATLTAAPGDPVLSRADLAADVEVLQRAYEQLHPGLYRYNTPEEMRGHFETLRLALDHDQPLTEAFLALSRFAATVRCGHTYPNPHNQPKAVREVLEAGARVPFEFRWLDGRMIVTRDLTPDASLPRGTEVTAIADVPVGQVRERLLAIARADGSNDAKRLALLEVRGEEKYETFDLYLRLFFPQVDRALTLDVRAPGGALRRLTVAPLTHAQRLAARKARPDDETYGWRLDLSRPSLAILRMPTWSLYDAKWDWKAFLARSFEQVAAQRPAALVIDLRGNEGGLDVGDEILPHLIERELALPEPARRVRYRAVPAELEPVLDTWDPSFKDWGEAARPFDDRFFTLVRDDKAPAATILRPRPPRFAGRVFVLVGATNSSATFQFAQAVQKSGLGTLVGQPTGGNQRGINGGAFFFLRLPRTRIEMDLPLIGTFPDGNPPDAGLQPDIAVIPTAADVADGRDVEMEAVERALRRP